MRTSIVRAAIAMALVPATAGAQSLTLTESEALARLSSDSPRVRAIRAPVDVARVDVLAARRWPNPKLTVDRESVAGVTEYLTMIAQPLPISGRRELAIQAATATAAASASRADDGVRRLRADLRLAFADLVAAQTRERELTSARDRLRDLAQVLATREAAGDAAGFDRLRAEREVLDLDADLAVAAADRARAQAVLAGYMSDVQNPSQIAATAGAVAATAAAVSSSTLAPLETLLMQAESTRAELRAFRRDADAARFAARAAERSRVPEPEIVAGTKSSSLSGGDVGSVLTVHASIPVFDRARPERALAEAHAAQAEARAASFLIVLRGDVTALREAVILRRDAAARYRADALASAAQIERIAQVSYDAGERSILELLDAYRLGASARTRQASLDLAVRQAEIELAFAIGSEGL
jgi:cobalt-zinc-cadmium efflux system outer membrane protein